MLATLHVAWAVFRSLRPGQPCCHRLVQRKDWPDATTWLLATAYAAASLAIGGFVFMRLEDRLGEQL